MQEMSLTSFWIFAGSCVLGLRHRMCEQMARTAGNHACRRHQSGDPFDNRKPWF